MGGSWFHEKNIEGSDGPCKICDTVPPTFLARTEALRAIWFHPRLDSEWALLDFSMRTIRTPLVEMKQSSSPGLKGWRHGAGSFAVCPFVNFGEVGSSGKSHLYGRRDIPETGKLPSEPWFGRKRLGSFGGAFMAHLIPSEQAKLFANVNNLREFLGLDGIVHHFGCNLDGPNCAVPDWIYRGWAIPPCCKRTMRHLLFFIDDIFQELGIRYILTDGALLGSYKFGGLLDWDADVDLHIHSDDFPRLENEVQHYVKREGHYLRKHENNESWLLQANEHNYLLIELNKRSEVWDPDHVWYMPIDGRLFPTMERAHLNLSAWYGFSFFRHRLRHVPEWEEELRPMFCGTPYHFNCVDDIMVPSGEDCQNSGIC